MTLLKGDIFLTSKSIFKRLYQVLINEIHKYVIKLYKINIECKYIENRKWNKLESKDPITDDVCMYVRVYDIYAVFTKLLHLISKIGNVKIFKYIDYYIIILCHYFSLNHLFDMNIFKFIFSFFLFKLYINFSILFYQ